jgi:hypothetical protein
VTVRDYENPYRWERGLNPRYGHNHYP